MGTKKTYILGIESSCDDTAAAVISDSVILSNIVASQSIHELYGGVVPELASREHQKLILPIVDKVLKQAGISVNDLSAVAFTNGPGLVGSLMVGTSFAKSMSLALDIPLIAVNHMQAHILAHFIHDPDNDNPDFPFLALTISGGHTQIVKVNSPFDMQVLGETLDDAAGEAFDKSAKILGLPYPGGPLIDKHAKNGNILAFEFGKPNIKNLDFSFSGLKTSIMYKIQNNTQKNPNFIKENLEDLCASIQHSIVTILLIKLQKAIKQTGIKEIAIAGGVSANSYLRSELQQLANEKHYKLYVPKFEYCTDNAAMIAISGYFKFLEKDFAEQNETPSARLLF